MGVLHVCVQAIFGNDVSCSSESQAEKKQKKKYKIKTTDNIKCCQSQQNGYNERQESAQYTAAKCITEVKQANHSIAGIALRPLFNIGGIIGHSLPQKKKAAPAAFFFLGWRALASHCVPIITTYVK
jgi:hypothetical protein